MYGVIIKLIFLTPNDERIWKEDPEEYVRRDDDFT